MTPETPRRPALTAAGRPPRRLAASGHPTPGLLYGLEDQRLPARLTARVVAVAALAVGSAVLAAEGIARLAHHLDP
jgi:hypothetical protein